jgi:predicted Zn-ribbon and HTH transcriptional regulator
MTNQATTSEETFSFSVALRALLERLPSRSRDIVEARFGISGEEPKTLEEIGRTYKITRERVRQVVGSALGFLSSERANPVIASIAEMVQAVLREKGGAIEAEELLAKLAQGDKSERGALLAFLEGLSGVKESRDDKEHGKMYMLETFSVSEWKKLKEDAKKILVESGEPLEAKDFSARFVKTHPQMNEKRLFDLLALSKEVKKNVFGKWGLATWSDIRPRGTREKAYLVLKTSGEPLHFRDIAMLIDKHGLQGKKAKSHPQTVHNELIKDKRFILVGRGIYALSEWGYKRGTVKDVIADVLREASKPLSREEVLEAVFKLRQVKRSTVIINLNTFFARIGKNAYTIKK